jgi:CBS domain-containing protein
MAIALLDRAQSRTEQLLYRLIPQVYITEQILCFPWRESESHLPLLVDDKVVKVITLRQLLLDLADDGAEVLDVLLRKNQ